MMCHLNLNLYKLSGISRIEFMRLGTLLQRLYWRAFVLWYAKNTFIF